MPSQQPETPTSESSNDEAVQSRLAQLDAVGPLAQLLQNPNVQAVLAAERDGREVDVVDRQEKPAEEQPDLTEGLDESQTKFLKVIESMLNPLRQDVDGLKGLAQSVQQQGIKTEIQKVSEKYPDFPEHAGKMRDLAKEHAGLGIEDLYALAKLRSGKLKLTPPSNFSEKPSASTLRPTTKPSPNPNKPENHGRKAWNDSLIESLDRVANAQGDSD